MNTINKYIDYSVEKVNEIYNLFDDEDEKEDEKEGFGNLFGGFRFNE